VAVPQEGTCCPSDCSYHGICNPTTCLCACQSGFAALDCSITTGAFNSDGMTFDTDDVLLEMDSGLAADMGVKTGASIEDQCGDDVEEISSSQVIHSLNLDPVTVLLEKLKFQLFRSLTYERDTTNATKRECANELKQQDRDLEQLQQEVLMLGKLLGDMDAQTKVLTEKRDSQLVALTSLQQFVQDLSTKIDSSKVMHEAKFTSQQQELKTLQSMRDLISQISGTTCARESTGEETFSETGGVECYGELLDIELSTDDPAACKKLCVSGCVAFTFMSTQGCRFYSTVQSQTKGCGVDGGSCSCFQKA